MRKEGRVDGWTDRRDKANGRFSQFFKRSDHYEDPCAEGRIMDLILKKQDSKP